MCGYISKTAVWLRAVLLCLLAAFSLTSCLRPLPTGERGTETEIVWPAPPETARIRWIQEIRTPADAGIKPGFWRRLGNLAFGAQEQTVVRPYGVMADQEGRLLVADTGGGTLEIFDAKAGRHRQMGREPGPTLLSPLGLARDDQGRVYLTDSGAGTVFRLNGDGTFSRWVSSGLQRPTGIVFNPVNGLVYVSDTVAHQIVAFDSQGIERQRLGMRGNGSGQLNFPTDLAVDGRGRLIVTDALNARIQIFSPEGKPLSAFGEPGDVPGTLSKPKGVAVDSEGHIYVCDGMQDRVQIFDEEGRFLLAFGSSGRGPGEFWMPCGIWIDSRDRIYVADSFNRRIQVFQYNPEPVSGGGRNP